MVAGPYINWIESKSRFYTGAWIDIVAMPAREWHYVRIVADTEASVFHVYVANKAADARIAAPAGTDLAFRKVFAEPPAKVCFGTYGLAAPAYIDGLLVYEGDEYTEDLASMDFQSKLTTTWGVLKNE